MRVKYSFSSRRTRHIDKLTKQRAKYPQVAKNIVDTSDIILEVIDARFLKETRNKELEDEIKRQKKQIIYVLNKADLLKKKEIEKIKGKVKPYVIVSCMQRKGVKRLRDTIKIISKTIPPEKREKREIKKDRVIMGEDKRIKVGVIGYPNSGKSSLINILSGRSGAGVGSVAGFTKNVQKIRLSEDIILVDSPGVIPEDQYSVSDKEKISKAAIFGGKSYTQVKDPEIIVNDLFKDYSEKLNNYYKVNSEGSDEFIEEVGKAKNLLKKGGVVNTDKTSRLILKDWQEGRIKV